QQKILRIVKSRHVGGASTQQERIGQQRNRARGREIGQRAVRFFHVGLELIKRRVELCVAFVDQSQQRAQDERVGVGLMKDDAEALEDRARSGDVTRVEQREEELRIVAFELTEILDVTHLVADDNAEIPERIEEAVDEALLRGADAAAEEEQEIDIRVQAQVAAPVAAERDDGNGPVVRTRVSKQLADQRID